MNLRNYWKSMLIMLLVFAGAYHMPLSFRAFLEWCNGIAPPSSRVRQGACDTVPPAGPLHSGRTRGLPEKGSCDEVPGAKGEKGRRLRGGFHLRNRSCGLLVHGPAAVRRHLPHGCGSWPGDRVPLRRSGDKRSGHNPHCRVLGIELGVARAVGAVVFSVVIGLLMHLIFRKEETARSAGFAFDDTEDTQPLIQRVLVFASLVGLLVFANWSAPDNAVGSLARRMGVEMGHHLGVRSGYRSAAVLWLGVRAWKMLVVAVISGTAVLFHSGAQTSFGLGIITFAWALATSKGEGSKWAGRNLGFCEAHPSASLCRRDRGGSTSGQTGPRGMDTFGVGRDGSGRQLVSCQPSGLGCRRFHVLRHTHRDPHSPGAHRLGHGQGTGTGPAARRSGPFPSQHAGDPNHSWNQKNGNLRLPCDYHGRDQRSVFRHVLPGGVSDEDPGIGHGLPQVQKTRGDGKEGG